MPEIEIVSIYESEWDNFMKRGERRKMKMNMAAERCFSE